MLWWKKLRYQFVDGHSKHELIRSLRPEASGDAAFLIRVLRGSDEIAAHTAMEVLSAATDLEVRQHVTEILIDLFQERYSSDKCWFLSTVGDALVRIAGVATYGDYSAFRPECARYLDLPLLRLVVKKLRTGDRWPSYGIKALTFVGEANDMPCLVTKDGGYEDDAIKAIEGILIRDAARCKTSHLLELVRGHGFKRTTVTASDWNRGQRSDRTYEEETKTNACYRIRGLVCAELSRRGAAWSKEEMSVTKEEAEVYRATPETLNEMLKKKSKAGDQHELSQLIEIIGYRGPAARAVIPGLLTVIRGYHSRELHESMPSHQALRALCMFGPGASPAIPFLRSTLKDTDEGGRCGIVDVLGNIGPGAREAVPELLGAAGDRSFRVRLRALSALVGIAPDDPRVTAVLESSLADSEVAKEATEAIRFLEMRSASWQSVD